MVKNSGQRALYRFNLLISTAAKHSSKASGSKLPIGPATDLDSNCVAALQALNDLVFLNRVPVRLNNACSCASPDKAFYLGPGASLT